MAHMIPGVAPRPGLGRRAERALYVALQQGLDDGGWFVYHGLDILEHERAREGEIDLDFLLLHREAGLLVLECKGDGVRRTGEGRWVRARGDGGEEPMQSPFAQEQVKTLVGELSVGWAAPPCDHGSRRRCGGQSSVAPAPVDEGGDLNTRRRCGCREHAQDEPGRNHGHGLPCTLPPTVGGKGSSMLEDREEERTTRRRDTGVGMSRTSFGAERC